jgi:hypothetical protein
MTARKGEKNFFPVDYQGAMASLLTLWQLSIYLRQALDMMLQCVMHWHREARVSALNHFLEQ